MEATCPECRHLVQVDETGSGKCPNCGSIVRPFRAPFTGEPGASAPQGVQPSAAVDASDHQPSALAEVQPTVRAASVVSLVCGLLFFIPFVTQAIALLFGVVAVARRRLPNERVAAAWVGMILAIATVVGWVCLIDLFRSSPTWGPAFGPTWAESEYDAGDWMKPAQWEETMERVYQAARSYHRDYGEWPASVDAMKGRTLARDFTLSPELTYRPVPDGRQDDPQCILMFSAETFFDVEGEELTAPHRLVLRLSGKVELLPSAEVEALVTDDASDPDGETDPE
ncbi:MAG: hypothetical protein JSV78_05450 [Phycisphaerales bacterium]|nr:MAG: hypothetical protein JSV78_05450 [Phycisphaerales bacterium]